MQIRTMKVTDYEKVYALWMSCKNMGFNDIDDSKEGITRFLERNPNTSFVAMENDELLGIILGGHDGRRGYIYHMSVAENHRKKGIGSSLVEKCLASFKNEKISKVALLVFKYNEAGNSFWEKQGFILREDVNYRNIGLRELVRIDT
ncbi:MAG: GNAT family N-acetyltransferase [Spirochaetaceae bacterium]|nr:GNAT family N-acetyltransferase [Spirochaetaceae bacterium]